MTVMSCGVLTVLIDTIAQSGRCARLADWLDAGWRPNRHLRRMTYAERATFFGVTAETSPFLMAATATPAYATLCTKGVQLTMRRTSSVTWR